MHAHHARWTIATGFEDVILDVPVVDGAHNLIKKSLACLASRTKFFPTRSPPTCCPNDGIAVRSMLEQGFLFNVIARVLSDVCVVPAAEAEAQAIATLSLERHAIASCAHSLSGQRGSSKEAADAQLFYRKFRQTASNWSEFGMDCASAFPIGQLGSPTCSINSVGAHLTPAELLGSLQSLSLNRVGSDALTDPRLRSHRDLVKNTSSPGAFVVAKGQQGYRAARPRHVVVTPATNVRISPIKFDKYSAPHATRLADCDHPLMACTLLDTLNSLSGKRSMTRSQCSHLFLHMRIGNARSGSFPAKEPAVERACSIKKVLRTRDLRSLAPRQRNDLVEVSKPFAIVHGATARASSVSQFLRHRRPQSSTPHTHFFEGAAYDKVAHLRLRENQTCTSSCALMDRTALLTVDQVGLHALATCVLDSGLISDTCLIGHSMGGWVLQRASSLLQMSCECVRGGFFLDSRLQYPRLISDDDVGFTLRKKLDLQFPRHAGACWLLGCQSTGCFRIATPHTELHTSEHFFNAAHATSADMISHLALLTELPNTKCFGSASHSWVMIQCFVDASLAIRPYTRS